MAVTPIAGARTRGRIGGLDLARAIAMLGMLLVNFKLVLGAQSHGPEWLVAVADSIDGKAAVLFVVIAGVGVSLMAARPQAHGILWRRSVLLFLFGYAFSIVWPADILHFYGAYIALGLILIRASARVLALAALGAMVGFMVLIALANYSAHWDWVSLTYLEFWSVDGLIRNLLFNGFHPVVPWLAFFFLGMLIGRLDLNDRRVQRKLFIGGTTVFALAQLFSRVLLPRLFPSDDPILFSTSMMPPLPVFVATAASSATVVLASAIWLADRWPSARVLGALRLSGRLALTTYLAHVVLGMGTFEALGLLGSVHVALWHALAAGFLFWLLAVVFSVFWLGRAPNGPAEFLLRRLSDIPFLSHQQKESHELSNTDPQRLARGHLFHRSWSRLCNRFCPRSR